MRSDPRRATARRRAPGPQTPAEGRGRGLQPVAPHRGGELSLSDQAAAGTAHRRGDSGVQPEVPGLPLRTRLHDRLAPVMADGQGCPRRCC